MVLLSNFASIPLMCIDFALFALFFAALTTFALVSCQKESGSDQEKPGESKELSEKTKRKVEESEKSDRKRKSEEAPFEIEEATRPLSMSAETDKRSSRRSDKETITEEIVIPLGKTAKDPLPSSAMTSRDNLKVVKSISSLTSASRSVSFGDVRKVKSNMDLSSLRLSQSKEASVVTVADEK